MSTRRRRRTVDLSCELDDDGPQPFLKGIRRAAIMPVKRQFEPLRPDRQRQEADSELASQPGGDSARHHRDTVGAGHYVHRDADLRRDERDPRGERLATKCLAQLLGPRALRRDHDLPLVGQLAQIEFPPHERVITPDGKQVVVGDQDL